MTNDLTKLRRSRASLLLGYLTSVNDCMLEMIYYVAVMVDNAGAYSGGGIYTWRLPLPGQRGSYIYAHQDIDNINKAAIKCIDIIDKHVMPK